MARSKEAEQDKDAQAQSGAREQDKDAQAQTGVQSQSGVREEVQAQADARTGPYEDASLAEGEFVDPRLDGRTGAARPRRQEFPAVPQQIDGPDLAHQAEFTRKYLEGLDTSVEKGSRLGMYSPGPHGLSPLEERKGHDRGGESGGDVADDGESGNPDPAKAQEQAATPGPTA